MRGATEETERRWTAAGGRTGATAPRTRAGSQRPLPCPEGKLSPEDRRRAPSGADSDMRARLWTQGGVSMSRLRSRFTLAPIFAAALAGSAAAQGTGPACTQPLDPACNHLKCYQISDKPSTVV